jgi:hypothetical protein
VEQRAEQIGLKRVEERRGEARRGQMSQGQRRRISQQLKFALSSTRDRKGVRGVEWIVLNSRTLLGTEEGKQKGRNRLREGKRVCPAQIEERGVERGEERKKEHPLSYVELSRYSVLHIMTIMT